jgi:sugar lactone lactonase YvrE
LKHPESVAASPTGDAFYAANIGATLAPLRKDGDGFISRLSPDGSVETLRFLPAASSDATLHAPKGTVVLDGHLYTADIDRVVGFDLDTRTKIAEIDLASHGVTFVNDIAVADAQILFASATKQGRLYRIDLAAGTATALDVAVPGVNGVAYAGADEKLYAVTFGGPKKGRLWTLSMTEAGTVEASSTRTVKDGGRFDGIVRRGDQLLISSWGVKGTSEPALYRVGKKGRGAVTRMPLGDWSGAADFDCAPDRGCWIPDLPGSAVTVVRPTDRTP